MINYLVNLQKKINTGGHHNYLPLQEHHSIPKEKESIPLAHLNSTLFSCRPRGVRFFPHSPSRSSFLFRIHLPMATVIDNEIPNATSPPHEENPNKTLDPASPKPDADPTPTPTPPLSADDKTPPESKNATPPPADAANDAPLSDIQKKIRRAERFGISVQLSEKEKRNSRAERYRLSLSFLLDFSLPIIRVS